jgi:hypothetical protein
MRDSIIAPRLIVMYERVSLVYSFAWFDPLFSLEYVLYVGVEIPDLCMNENDV